MSSMLEGAQSMLNIIGQENMRGVGEQPILLAVWSLGLQQPGNLLEMQNPKEPSDSLNQKHWLLRNMF